jgi:hypothetical protein
MFFYLFSFLNYEFSIILIYTSKFLIIIKKKNSNKKKKRPYWKMTDENRSNKISLLKNYYKDDDTGKSTSASETAVDIDSTIFDPELYLNKIIRVKQKRKKPNQTVIVLSQWGFLLKEKTLHDLMDMENDIVKQIRSLDSEMQTLVYENYNKFISATDTIRKVYSTRFVCVEVSAKVNI